MTIHAHTESCPTPAFVNLTATGPATVKLTVRTRGHAATGSTGPVGTIDLSHEQLRALVADATTHLIEALA